MAKEYNKLLQGFISKLCLDEELKGTQYIKLLLTPNNMMTKPYTENGDVLSFSLPYPTYQELANKLNAPLPEVESDIEKAFSILKWDKRMWQDIMDYFGRLIEIDIYDGRFAGNIENFIWKWDDEDFIAYAIDCLYHIHYGIMEKREKGVIRLYDSKNDVYLDKF